MPRARTRARPSNYGFFPAPGTNYSYGQEPEIAKRLQKLGQALGLHLTGLSGYRTPAHSVEVGGFADDPHTRGQASDTPGVESVSETVLRRFGLTRPFSGASEADHIQLLGGARGTSPTRSVGRGYTLADLWIQAGGPRNLAPVMAAIAMAESGGKVDAVGGPNSDGSYDYGLWQINSVHSQFDKSKLTSDALYNAQAAVAVYRSQGLAAWTTYNKGTYRQFLGGNSRVQGAGGFGRTRPGGGSADGSSSDSVNTEFASYTTSFDLPILPGGGSIPIPNPLDIFKGASDAVTGVNDFLKWIAWLFHPKNILRAVEFVTGFILLTLGLHTMFEVYTNASTTTVGRKAKRGKSRARGKAGEVLSMTPAGRAMRVKRAASFGRREARAEHRAHEARTAAKRAKGKEAKKQATGSVKRAAKRDKQLRNDPPF